ncbi:MAG: IS110 family transposase [Balneolaceae bacterium]
MKLFPFILGVDVSKLTLDVCLLESASHQIYCQTCIDNTPKGVRSLLRLLKTHHIQTQDCMVCFESTGVYSIPLSVYCEQNHWNYCEVAALEIKRASGIKRAKTDTIDAKDIAFYALRNTDKLILSQRAETTIQQLKLLSTERGKLIKAIMLFESTCEDYDFLPKDVSKVVKQTNQRTLCMLKKNLCSIETSMKTLLEENERLQKQSELLQTIPGIGEATAQYMIITTKGFTSFSNSRKFACYSGIAPFEHSSGSSIRGKTRVSPLANKKMKALLHMASLSAIRHDPELRLYYQRKKAEGKHSMLVLNNVKFKLVQRAFAVIKRESPYVVACTFAA